MASENVINLTESNFESEVINSTTPVIVDFWATWCSPCKMIAPILDEIANEKAGAAKVTKVDVEQNPGLAARFNIRSIPTILFISNGEVKHQAIGLKSKQELISLLEQIS